MSERERPLDTQTAFEQTAAHIRTNFDPETFVFGRMNEIATLPQISDYLNLLTQPDANEDERALLALGGRPQTLEAFFHETFKQFAWNAVVAIDINGKYIAGYYPQDRPYLFVKALTSAITTLDTCQKRSGQGANSKYRKYLDSGYLDIHPYDLSMFICKTSRKNPDLLTSDVVIISGLDDRMADDLPFEEFSYVNRIVDSLTNPYHEINRTDPENSWFYLHTKDLPEKFKPDFLINQS